jgi:phosphoribosylcarboxyaminoimidazole (NCAIR) mutase
VELKTLWERNSAEPVAQVWCQQQKLSVPNAKLKIQRARNSAEIAVRLWHNSQPRLAQKSLVQNVVQRILKEQSSVATAEKN